MNRIVLVNPPGRRLYVRDYYCSKVSKSNYIYPSVDLLMQSGVLSDGFRVDLLDAMVMGWDVDRTLAHLKTMKPDGILALAGAASALEDLGFIQRMKEATGARILVSGDLFLETPEEMMEAYPALDGILLNLTSLDAPAFFSEEERSLSAILQRGRDRRLIPAQEIRGTGRQWSVPMPRHDLFLGLPYTYPFVRKRPFATLLTDFACPYRCEFCVFAGMEHRVRDVAEVGEEIRFLQRMGIQELYISDQTFGPDKDRALALCETFSGFAPMGWVCFLRADLAAPDLLDAMKKAGCHTIMFGAESGSSEILGLYKKGVNQEKIVRAIALAKERGLDTVATFVMGLPEDSAQTLQETLRFASTLGCTYASFNRFVPRFSTKIRERCLAHDLVDGRVMEMDQSGSRGIMGTETLSSEEVDRFRRKAVMRFYLHPSYLLSRLLRLRSWWDIQREIGGGLRLIQGLF